MTLALGGPVYKGILTPSEALIVGASFTAGLSVFMLMRSLQAHRRSR